jgi:hypothetical protein
VLYGAALRGLRLGGALIYRGTFATGLFQCVYQPAPAHWAMLPGTLEWHAAAALLALLALLWPPAALAAAAMLGLSLAVAALQAAQARLAPHHEGVGARLVVAALCYAQPLVRSWKRYRTRFFSSRRRAPALPGEAGRRFRLPWSGVRTAAYWSEEGRTRTELLDGVVACLNERRWGKVLDAGWSDWDLAIDCHRWTVVHACTSQEEHGGGRRLIRVRFRLRSRRSARALGLCAAAAVLVAAALHAGLGALLAAAALVTALALWRRGMCLAGRAAAVFEEQAARLNMVRCDETRPRPAAPTLPVAETEADSEGFAGRRPDLRPAERT